MTKTDKEDKVTVFLVHKGDTHYLSVALEHLRRVINDVNVVLIGDDNNSHYDVKHVNYKDHFDEAIRFEDIYIHVSPNDYSYELFCFQRWFCLLDVMEKYGVSHGVYIDSDVLFNKVSREMACPGDSWVHCDRSAHTAAFSQEKLRDFCGFMKMYYKDNHNDLIKASKCHGEYVISDMTLSGKYAHKNDNVNLSYLCRQIVYDSNVCCTDSLEYNEGKKEIYYQMGDYFFKDPFTRDYVLAGSIHFQGKSKQYMESISKLYGINKDNNNMYKYNWANRKFETVKQDEFN